MQSRKLKSLAAAAVAALGLAACGGGDAPPPPQVEPSAYERALAAIDAAGTAGAAQAAHDDVDGTAITGAQAAQLAAALGDRKAALAEAARIAAQKVALKAAADAIDTSDLSDADAVAAARGAVNGLKAALDAADGVSDAGKAMYRSVLDDAEAAVRKAEAGLDARDRMTAQRTAITDALTEAREALRAVNDGSTEAEVMAADAAVAALGMAIDDAAGLPEGDLTVARARGSLGVLVAWLAAARERRTAALEKAREAEMAAIAARAAKLFPGIAPQDGTPGPSRRHAAHAADGDDRILVLFGAEPPEGTVASLVPDEEALVPENHGWQGRRYASPSSAGAPPGDGFEAVVYSNVEGLGRKFGSATAGTGAGREFEYMLADGALALVSGGSAAPAFSASRVGSQRFVNIADVKRFRLRGDATNVLIPGRYFGVPGTYDCTPGAGGACAVRVAAAGFDLGTVSAGNAFTENGGTWTFRPDDPNARVVNAVDSAYASYGWWLRTAGRNGQRFGALDASAFEDEKGGVPAAGGIDTLYGTATYAGGAAGQYALSSLTGGINDAGSFVARAAFEADFTGNTVSGTIDGFTGADGMARDWSVALADQAVSAGGAIAGDGTPGSTARQLTLWTIGGKAVAASGEWTGTFRDNGADGVPRVVTGTFHAEFGHEGRMVGGFGANRRQDRTDR